MPLDQLIFDRAKFSGLGKHLRGNGYLAYFMEMAGDAQSLLPTRVEHRPVRLPTGFVWQKMRNFPATLAAGSGVSQAID